MYFPLSVSYLDHGITESINPGGTASSMTNVPSCFRLNASFGCWWWWRLFDNQIPTEQSPVILTEWTEQTCFHLIITVWALSCHHPLLQLTYPTAADWLIFLVSDSIQNCFLHCFWAVSPPYKMMNHVIRGTAVFLQPTNDEKVIWESKWLSFVLCLLLPQIMAGS